MPLAHATPVPFDRALDGQMPDFLWLERLLDEPRQRAWTSRPR